MAPASTRIPQTMNIKMVKTFKTDNQYSISPYAFTPVTLIPTMMRMIMTGTSQEGKAESLPIQNSTMTAEAANSAGMVKAQLMKYIHCFCALKWRKRGREEKMRV